MLNVRLDTKQSFGVDCLPYIIGTIRTFTPPYPTTTPETLGKLSSLQSLLETDVEVLDQCSSLLEALSLDVDAVLKNIGKSVDALGRFGLAHHRRWPLPIRCPFQ